MTTIHRPGQGITTTDGTSSSSLDSARRPSAQLILDGVVAGYIHAISGRHPQRQPAGDAAAPSEAPTLSA